MNESIFLSHYAAMNAEEGFRGDNNRDIERWLKKETKRRNKAREIHKAVCLAIANRGRPVELTKLDEYREEVRSTAAKGMGFIASFFLGWMLRILVSIVVEWMIGRMSAGKMSAGEMDSLKEWGAKP